jgi:hypothetical protein
MIRDSHGMALAYALLVLGLVYCVNAQAQTPASTDTLMTIIAVRPAADIEREIMDARSMGDRADLAKKGFDRERKLAETRIGLKEKEIESLELKQEMAEQQKKTAEAGAFEADIKTAESMLKILKSQLSVREAEVAVAEAQSALASDIEDGLVQEKRLQEMRLSPPKAPAGSPDHTMYLAAVDDLMKSTLEQQVTVAEKRGKLADEEEELASLKLKLLEAQLALSRPK